METRTEPSRLQSYYVNQVASIAGRTFGRDLDPEMLRRQAQQAVLELVRDGGRLTAFVPELALRSMRDAIELQLVRAGVKRASTLAA